MPVDIEHHVSGIAGDHLVDTARQNGNSDLSNVPGEPIDAQSVEKTARLVFAFVSSASDLSESLDKGNDVQLLRLRTRKNEIVVVPGEALCRHRVVMVLIVGDSKYLLVVIHDPSKSS